MICPPCRTAGEFLKTAKGRSAYDQRMKAFDLEYAEGFHRQCEHPDTCGCHHSLDMHATQPAIGR